MSRLDENEESRAARHAKLTEACRMIIEAIGEDPLRDGLLRTPDRYASALLFLTQGYEERIEGTTDQR